MKPTARKTNRKGAVAAFMALLLIPMLALVALCVDYGYLLVVKTDLQRAADATALAAVRDLVPDADGSQDLSTVRATIREYAAANVGQGFTVRDQDITIGRFDPATIYGNLEIRSDGILDTVQITLRRDELANNPVSLFFARIIGLTESTVTATSTAVLQKAQSLPPGTDILPIAIPESEWNDQSPGQDWSVYGDGKIIDNDGYEVPGNFGTLDIGATNNSTRDLVRQINSGLNQTDLSRSLYRDGRINSPDEIGGNEQFWAQADTGLSAGIQSAVTDNHGYTKLVPIMQTNNGDTGNNLEYLIVGWGVVQIMDSEWSGGATNRHVTIKKAYMYDEDLRPASNLSETDDIIEAAYTSPVLVWPFNPVADTEADE